MLTIIPPFAFGATDLMAIFLLMSGLAMLIIILASMFYVLSVNTSGTSVAIDGGLAVLAFTASKFWMASLLQMVALINGIGGGTVSAIAAVELLGNTSEGTTRLVAALIGALIGAVSLSGSLIAWTKLNGVIDKPLRPRSRQAVSLAVVVTAFVAGGYVVFAAPGGDGRLIAAPALIYLLMGCALLFGVLMTLLIGRAQMPVVISIYNGCTGLAVGLEGFVLQNPTLVIAGVAIGAARMLLTLQMARQ